MGKDIAALCAALADEVDFIGMPMRNLVAGLVERGQIVPDEAEAWARESDAEPFAQTPDLAKFDAMAEPDWTLAMATAWAAWRTPQAVRRVWAPYIENWLRWVPCDDTVPMAHGPGGVMRVVGHRLLSPGLAAPDDVLLSIETWTAMAKASPTLCLDPPLISADQAEGELRAALRAGTTLVARHGTMAEVVDRHVWSALSPFVDGRGGSEDVHDRGGVVRFHRVRVERDAVLAVWPALPAPDAFALAVAGVMSMPADGRGVQAPEMVALAGPDPIISAPEQKDEDVPPKPKRATKGAMGAAAKARNDGRAEQIAARDRTLRRLLAERSELTVTQGAEALRAEFGANFPASRGTVQAAMAAIRAEKAEKK